MIAKCKAISHGKEMLNYAMRDQKIGSVVASNMLMGDNPEAIFEEMEAVNRYNSRCKNKYLRFEIGIAPKDEKRLTPDHLTYIVKQFAEKMGLKNNQWIACTHKDTDNLHIHFVANRIGIDGKVYQTDFVSNRSAHAAEEISREIGMTIAKEVQAQKAYIKAKSNRDRLAVKAELQQIAYGELRKPHKIPKELLDGLKQQGVDVCPVRNKKGTIYGIRFGYKNHTFKASEIGREFGLHSMFNHFGQTLEGQKGTPFIPKYYQAPKPILEAVAEVATNAVANATSAAGELASAVGGIFDLSNSDGDSAQAEFLYQTKKDELQRKKKRGRGI